MALIPNFTTGNGPNEPRNRPEDIFFPATSNDGPARTVAKTDSNYYQPSPSLYVGLFVAQKKPVQYMQVQRTYCTSRRTVPRRF